jgi:4-hydroxy-tetrahydrodipicolinate synthase
MAISVLPGGLWPVMLTPFCDDGSVDFDGLRRLTDFYLDAGSAGLFANCLSSEMFQLSPMERLGIVECVVQQAVGRAPVVACGNFGRDPATVCAFIRKMADTGATAVVLITGLVACPEEDEGRFRTAVEAILDKTGAIPLGLYECPQPYKRLLSPGLMAALAGSGRFLYHKDTSSRQADIRQKLQAVAGTVLGFYNADTPTALQSLADGAQGLSPIGANFYPELYVALLDRFQQSGAGPEVRELHAQLAVMDRLCHHIYPWSAKHFLKLRGLQVGTALRLTSELPAEGDRLRLEALHGMFRMLSRNLGIPLVLP